MSTEILAYDLRQKYAEIVGFHLEQIAKARIEKNYPAYFNALEDLETIINHKFKKRDPDKKQKKTQEESYKELKEVAINTANKYKSAFLGSTSNPSEVNAIQESLREIERFFYKVMDGAKMFGSAGYNEKA